MKRIHGINFLYILFTLVLIALGILSCSAKAMIFYKQSASQRSVLRGVESITAATNDVAESFSKIVEESIDANYDHFVELAGNTENSQLKETDIDSYFKLAVISDMKKKVGGNEGLGAYITSVMPMPKVGTLMLDENNPPYFELEREEDGGLISAQIKNVTFIYNGIPGITRQETINYAIDFPQVVFHAGNEEILDYSMMAGKGIYITGRTSSIVGDIYAGEHTAAQSRDFEIAYGEIGSYGGINFQNTQIGIQADRVISEADVNLSGSFVIMNPIKAPGVECYGGEIRKMRGMDSDSMYSIVGDYYSREAMSEENMAKYISACETAKTALSGIAEIPFYYDSCNDSGYEGEYRKIISSEDVEITEDITGIVFSAGNIIIHADCNIEGLVMCGDRIYMQGNNNVVSNSNIVKTILSEEINEDNSKAENEDEIVIRYNTLNDGEEVVSSGIVYHAIDYIGGLVYPGIRSKNYYVIPYQE